MTIKQVTACDYVVPERCGALSSYLGKVAVGSEVDIRTPFWDGSDRSKVVDLWLAVLLNKLPNGILKSLEMRQATKVGPLSVQLPMNERMDDVLAYYQGDNFDGDVDLLQAAIGKVSLAISKRLNTLRPLSYERASGYMQGSTNSGLPYFSKRSSVLDRDLVLADHDEVPPCVLGWRGQSSGTNIPKQRVVWMFPQSVNLREMRYFQPLFELMKNRSECAAWNQVEVVNQTLTNILTKGRTVVSIDFSGFDQTIQKTLRDAAMQVIANIYQRSYSDEIMKIGHIAGNIELLGPGMLFSGVHGEPSGSTLTNMRDTIVNWIASEYVAMRLNTHVSGTFQGDDGVLDFNQEYDVEELGTVYKELGLIVNPTKQYVANGSAMYLQRLHDLEYTIGGVAVGVYPTMRALNSLLGMERFHKDWDAKMFSLRAIMILENCKYHPLFERFVEFAVAGDKYKLGISSPGGISGLIKQLDRAKAIPGFQSTYNAPKLAGLADFETVKILRRIGG